MRRSYKFRRFRLSIRSFALCVSFCCFIGITLWNFNEENVDTIEEKYIYPPPWFISNWTMNDYFIRKDRLKQLDDRYAQKHQQKVLIESNRKIKPNFTILEYTKVSGGPKFCHQTDELTFGKQCPYKNCRYTCDHSFEKTADVLLMHRTDIHYDQLPKPRNLNQIWLFWHDEALGVEQNAIDTKFNWTISYRFGSEAHIGAYGLTVLRERRLSTGEFNSYIDEQFTKRESNAVWFVSNCQPRARLEYYKKLQSVYPSMKVYGNCVQNGETKSCARESECESLELSTNKYYLSFESQSCRDYITEKFWRSLAYGIIPIVFGPKEKLHLERIAPPNSFIFTGDFDFVEELAQHLNEINQSRTLFANYHRWRQFYQVLYRHEDLEHKRFCELCYRLNTNTKTIFYENINQFFLDEC